MFKIILKYLKRRKLDVAIIIIATSLLSVITLFALLIATDICNKKKDNAIDMYGSFICGGTTNNKRELSDIIINDKLITGTCSMLGNVVVKGVKLPIGVPDSNFLKLSSCNVIEGRLPKKGNEIALQKYAIKMFDNVEIGNSIKITINNQVEEYIVTGFVNNYSMTLNINVDKPSEYCYPVIILGDEKRLKKEYISFLVGEDDVNGIGYDEEKQINKIKKELKNEELVQFTNDNLFSEGFEYCRELQTISIIFSLIVFALSMIICINVYKILYKNIRKESGIFAILGATGKQRKKFLFFQIIGITFFSMMLSSCLIILLIFVCKNHICSSSLWEFNNIICYMGCWYVGYILFVVIFLVKEYYIIWSSSIRENLLYSRKSIAARVKSNHNLLVKMSGANVVDIIKYLSVFIVLFVCLWLITTLRVSFVETPNYELISQNIDVSEVVKGYEIKENIGKNYNMQLVDDILKKYTDAKIILEPDLENTTLLIEKNNMNSFFHIWAQNHTLEDTDVTDSKIVANWPKDANIYQPLHDVDYLIVSDEEYDNICKQVNIKKSKSGIILYLPSGSKLNSEDSSYIGFGSINTRKGIKFKKNNLKIDGVINKAGVDIIDKNTRSYSEQLFDHEAITVLINKSAIIKNHIIRGYSRICVYLNNTMEDNSALNNDMSFLQSEVQGGTLYSKNDIESKVEDYNFYVKNIGILLIVIVIAIAIVYSVCNIIFYMKMNSRKIGIMIILGVHKKTALNIRVLSNLKSILYAMMIAIIVVTLLIYDGTNAAMCIRLSLLSFICDVILASIDCALLYILLKKINIKKVVYS